MPNKTIATIPTQGVHHLTLVGASRKISIDFWQGVLGMPFVFEQPNLDNADESHLYFDSGDGRLITIFTTRQIYRGVLPFVVIQLVGLGLLALFPQVVTIVPDLLK